MKNKSLILIPAMGLGLLLASCGGTTTEATPEETVTPADNTETTTEENTGTDTNAGAIDTPDNAANTFCAKMQELEMAAEADKERLENELNELENTIEAAHDGDDAWFNEFETKLETLCPEA